MTASFCPRRLAWPRRAALGLFLSTALLPFQADAGVACDDRFKISTIPTLFDGVTLETVMLSSQTVLLEVQTFAQWRPDEEKEDGAALTLRHQKLRDVTVAICPLVPPGLPDNAAAWLEYQLAVAVALGEGTTISAVFDSTATPGGVRILGWDTREAHFTRTADGKLLAEEFHFLLTNQQRGLRIILTAPRAAFADALVDLRFWLSRVQIPEKQN